MKNAQTINLSWVCEKLGSLYGRKVEPAELLAWKAVQEDVVVIGPDGRKFRLHGLPKTMPVKRNLQ